MKRILKLTLMVGVLTCLFTSCEPTPYTSPAYVTAEFRYAESNLTILVNTECNNFNYNQYRYTSREAATTEFYRLISDLEYKIWADYNRYGMTYNTIVKLSLVWNGETILVHTLNYQPGYTSQPYIRNFNYEHNNISAHGTIFFTK